VGGRLELNGPTSKKVYHLMIAYPPPAAQSPATLA